MDEGDDYVPQISQMGDYGMGMQPSHGYPQGMAGGMQAMANPYDHQTQAQQQHQMMMMQQQQQQQAAQAQHRSVPPQQQHVPATAPAKKSRSKKKAAASDMDPMASMAAMSNNPMMRPSMGQMAGPYQPGQMGMYPGQGYPGAAAGPGPAGSAAAQQAYRGTPQGAAGQYPPGYPAQMYQQAQRGYPPAYGYPQQPGFPQQYPQQAMRPQYPGQSQHPPGYWDPQQQQQQQQAPTAGAQPQQNAYPDAYAQAASSSQADWARRSAGPVPGGPAAAAAAAPTQATQQQQQPSHSQHLYQLECDMHRCQQRLQQLYQAPRAPATDQEMVQLQQHMQYMQGEHYRLVQMVQQQQQQHHQQQQSQVPTSTQGPGSQQPVQQQIPQQPKLSTTPTSQLGLPQQPVAQQPGMMPGQQPVAQPGAHQAHQPPVTGAPPTTPVQVNQTGNQVQLNITSEKSRTLISVYHNYDGTTPTTASDDPMAFPSAGGSAASSNESKDSIVPPEPTPSVSHLQQQSQYGQPQPMQVNQNGIKTEPLTNGQPDGYGQYMEHQPQKYAASYPETNGVAYDSRPTSAVGELHPTPPTFVPTEEPVAETTNGSTGADQVEIKEQVEVKTEAPSFDVSTVSNDATAEAVATPIEKPEVTEPVKAEEPELKVEVPVVANILPEHEQRLLIEDNVATPPMYMDPVLTETEKVPEPEPVKEEGGEPEVEADEQEAETKSESIEESEAGPSSVDKPSEKSDDIPEDEEEAIFTEPSTPALSTTGSLVGKKTSTKKRGAAYIPKSSKKKKSVDDSDDDDDFHPDKKSRKKAKAAKKKRDDEDDEDEVGEVVKKTGKWADLEISEDPDDEFLEPTTAEAVVTTVNDADAMIIEKILNSRKVEGSEEEQYLIKWKGRSYVHCDWKTAKELEELDKRSAGKVKRFIMKKPAMVIDDEEEFNPDYTVVDRIVDVTVDEDGTEFALVKWKSLGYEEVTWEAVETVPADKVQLWRDRQVIDKAKIKEKPRPKEPEWRKIPNTCVWKAGNTLREYQFEGVNWLLYCYYYQRNCILADEMGLGKTVQTITFLSKIYEYGIHGPFLIVVPLSTIQNWVREFETWTDMNAIVYHGSSHAREVLQQFEIFYNKDHSGKQWKKGLVKIDALITTFEMVVTDCEFLKKIPWRVCVIDEAHRLKNRNCKLLVNGLHALRMEHRVLLTGTPLQNNIEELFSLLNFLHPLQFNSSADFLEQFGNCQSDEQVQKLQEILKPMMLRRLKEDVEKSLQPKEETIIEVQLSDTQKKFYRAILERNFTHLCKGTSAPSLMNVMMELRKCCNHPFLINGAEETIMAEFKLMHPEWDDETLQQKALIQASGKVVLIEKLLPKLRKDGHKVLVFSQMVKVLDLLEEFLVNSNYPYERIDGNIRGDLRQASIDRFSKQGSDRFVFLLCTRAGGLGINLTAADTVIIFDSDWNPQNDLQAQARCHRIGQKKMVKVYRLVTANTYEREMFDKASLKLGLDKAVLQSTTALKESSTSLSKKDIEELLKKGAYGSIMDENSESSKFNEEDIDTILQRRTQTITLEAGQKGSLFAKASFNSSNNRGDDIDLDDPEFWTKWAEKAQVDVEKATATADGKELIIQEPRKRTKRFEGNAMKEDQESDSDDEGGKNGAKKNDRQDRRAARKRRREDEDGDYSSSSYRPDELAIHKTEYFKVEKVLAQWGWGRWSMMKKSGDLEMSEQDIEHMSRTLLLHCIREFRGDDRVRQFVFQLILPTGAKLPRADGSAKNSIYHQGWAALPEFNPPSFALDSSFQRHVHRYANKLMVKIDQLKHLELVILGSEKDKAEDVDVKWTDITLKETPQVTEAFVEGWDTDCDVCLLIGVWRHGLENFDIMKTDEKLCFQDKDIPNWPAISDLALRFRRVVAASQRNLHDPVYERLKWTRNEEKEYMRVLNSFGIIDCKDAAPGVIDWEPFRAFSPYLAQKSAEELQEYLYCVLAMCTKVQGGELSAMDNKRAGSIDLISGRRAVRLMNRLHLTRKIHSLCEKNSEARSRINLCSMENMPNGWTTQHDKDLLDTCDQNGIDGLASNCLRKPSFEKIVRPSERTLLRRVLEIVTTCENGKWCGTQDVDSIEDSDGEEKSMGLATSQAARLAAAQQAQSARRGRKRVNPTNDNEAKMRALLQQCILSSASGGPNNDLSSAILQSLVLPQLMAVAQSNTSSQSSTQQQQQQQQAQLQLMTQLMAMSAMSQQPQQATSSKSSSSANQAAVLQQQQQLAAMSALMSLAMDPTMQQQLMQQPSTSKEAPKKPPPPKKEPAPTTSAAATAAAPTSADGLIMQQLNASGIGIQELMVLSQFPPETRIPMISTKTREKLTGNQAPQLKDLTAFLVSHPDYILDLKKDSSSAPTPSATTVPTESAPPSAKPSAPPTPAPLLGGTPTPGASVPATPSANSPKLEPGEVKKSPTATVNIKTSCTLQIEDPIAVFNRTTGELLPPSKFPKTKDLQTFLEANPDVNVHSSCALIAQIIVGTTHANRIGGDPDEKQQTSAVASGAATPATVSTPAPPLTPSTTAATLTPAQMMAMACMQQTPTPSVPSSSKASRASQSSVELMAKQQMEAMQLMFLQQAMLQQSVLMGTNPYAMSTGMTSATTSTPTQAQSVASSSMASSSTPSTSKQHQQQQQGTDDMNPMVLQALMSNPLLLQSLMMSDPTTAMAFASAAQQHQQQGSSNKKSKQ